MIKKGMLIIFILGQSLSIHAQLIEIADHGGVPVASYFERIKADDPEPEQEREPLTQEQVAEQFSLKNRLPMVSKLLSPGRVQPRKWNVPLFVQTTVALVGDDRVSMQWLKRKKTRLEKLETTIMMVNVKTEQQVKQVQAYFPNNQVLVMPGDDVARQLKIRHYPVLITAKGISQ